MVDRVAVAVARRAAEQAAAAGVALPDDLQLWALAGGRPEAAPVPGEPEELGVVLEAALDPADRRRQGAHYTPPALAAGLVERAIGRLDGPTVGDPACGGGALLLAAARHLAARGERRADVVTRLWGADIDPVAVATTEAALALWAGTPPPAGHLAVAEALLADLAWPPLDVVVGNPPFLSQLGEGTARTDEQTAALRIRFGDAVRAYTDPASLFLLRACGLTAIGGRVAMVQPQSVLGARDAAAARVAVEALGRLADVWFPESAGFDAAVDVCVPIIEVGAAPVTSHGWSAHLARVHGVPAVDLAPGPTLGGEAIVTAGFRTEYYGMVEHVHEADERPDGVALVTTGLVDLGGIAWGARPARVGGRRWDRPVVEVEALAGRAADWVARTGGPKLAVATQTSVVEVAVDEEGSWIPAVPLVVVLAPVERLWALAAALAAPAISAWLLHRAAGTALTSRSLKVTAPLLREVPLPSDGPAWAEGTSAFRAGDLDAFAASMTRAYGTDEAVSAWWRERARTVWSPVAALR